MKQVLALLGIAACLFSVSCTTSVGKLGCSSGIARGDFNGDGFSDLAIGLPGKAAVVVIYGSAFGLNSGGDVKLEIPQSQMLRPERFDASLAQPGGPGLSGVTLAGLRFGASLAAGDFNRDGYSDLGIGMLSSDQHGTVFVIYGSEEGFADDAPKQTFFDPENDVDGEFGRALAWGDFNGDGCGDLAIGDPRSYGVAIEPGSSQGSETGPVGKVTIVYGTPDGLGMDFNQNPATPNGGQEIVPVTAYHDLDVDGSRVEFFSELGEEFGAHLSGGDYNGDGRTDLAVSASMKDVEKQAGGARAMDSGAVFVFFARPNALYNAFREDGEHGYVLPDKVFGIGPAREGFDGLGGTPSGNERFGAALASGDFDGDARRDLAIGTPFENVEIGGDQITSAGTVRVVYDLDGAVTNQFWIQDAISGAGSCEADDAFGAALAAGDFNGDGRADLAIGVPNEDVQNSSGSDVQDAGEVNVIYGSASGLSTVAREPQVWSQGSGIMGAPSPQDRFGSSLTAWNFGQNEFTVVSDVIVPVLTADLAIGVPGEDVSLPDETSATDAGSVNVLYGNKEQGNGLRTNSNQLWTLQSPGIPGDAASGDRMGEALY